MTLSQWDDYPVHQAPELIRHPATSDRNFYDRYYFNLHPARLNGSLSSASASTPISAWSTPSSMCAAATISTSSAVSQPLGDRRDTSVGPFRVEVIEPLRRLRVVVEPTEHPVAMDMTWEGHIPAVAEPRQFLRGREKVIFDTQRLVQTGTWSGTMSVDGEEVAVSSEQYWGNRDRSWGIRPVGEPELGGVRANDLVLAGMWNYFPMQFDDHAILYTCHEQDDGARPLVQAERVWSDPERGVEELGRSEHQHRIEPGTRVVQSSLIRFPETGIEVECESILPNFVSVGTGYGIDADWRHGMYHGPDPVVEGLTLEVDEIRAIGQYGIVDHLARFTYEGNVGFGLLEQGFFGPYRHYGMTDGAMGAPGD